MSKTESTSLRDLLMRRKGTPTPAANPRWAKFPVQATIPIPDSSAAFHYGLRGTKFHEIALMSIGRMNMAGLRPEHDVLDIGCGIGRTARYLCDYIKSGSYEGFDTMSEPVQWCQENITPLCPNFRFRVTPLFNTMYNPDETLPSAAEFVFPYSDQAFDFVFAHSVFTHLLPDAATNYLHEIGRVLRPGRISYTTWHLFNDDQYRNPLGRTAERDESGTFAVGNPSIPEASVGYDEAFVREAHTSGGLKVVEPVHPGVRGLLQDVIVAVK
jgi:SAM-dependent methyltransferase